MIDALALRRRRDPDSGARALFYFSLIAATGFAVGWAAQAVGGF